MVTRFAPRYARPLLGREALLAQVRELIATRGSVVTLAGPGGVGKTRLASAAVQGLSTVFVPLRGARDADEAVEALADALGLRNVGDPEDAALDAVGERIVVLDEAEGVAGLGSRLGPWVDATPRASWLVTSRRPVAAAAEVVVEVAALATTVAARPDEPSPAECLLMAAAPNHIDRDAHAEAIAAILRMSGGLPLAIELAAARLALLSVEALRDRIDLRYFATLRDPERPERSLETVLDESWRHLEPASRLALGQITVFASHFTVADAEAIVAP